MTGGSHIITGTLPDGSVRFACVDERVRFTEAMVSDRKLGAVLRPFRSSEDAVAALAAIGATVEEGGGR